MLLAAGCGNNDDSPSVEVSRQDAAATYAAGVHSAYASSLHSAAAMAAAIDAFLASPSEAAMQAARQAWLVARADYGPTEVFRFYGGPIDDEETGTEGLINAWPLDEAYIDYVEGNPNAGIVNDPAGYPEITADLIVELNEAGGEANVSTGWHAIEFLLWGQDLDPDGPGDRPASDYTTAPNADRRGQYLRVASDQLVAHLEELVAAWAPGRSNYRSSFEALDPDEALRLAFTGIGEMSRGELAGEQISLADPEAVRAATGYAIGGTPPFGHLNPLPAWIDQDLLAYDTVWAAAGTPDSCFPIAPAQLIAAAGALAGDFARR